MLLDYFKELIISLPFNIYFNFVLEEKYGFNKATVKTFILDRIKGFGLLIIFMPIVLYLILWVLDWGGEYFYIYVIIIRII